VGSSFLQLIWARFAQGVRASLKDRIAVLNMESSGLMLHKAQKSPILSDQKAHKSRSSVAAWR
jgi:hypothetical protein